MGMSPNIDDRELAKFVETTEGETAIRVIIDEDGTEAPTDIISLIDLDDANIIYSGKAVAGSTKAASKWQIKRIDLTANVIEILYANSEDSFDKVWNDRGTYTYG